MFPDEWDERDAGLPRFAPVITVALDYEQFL